MIRNSEHIIIHVQIVIVVAIDFVIVRFIVVIIVTIRYANIIRSNFRQRSLRACVTSRKVVHDVDLSCAMGA